ncbi:MAG TPA: ATP-binding protein, partial [Opitutales bacterium]|nr:ATP-binding protein [Opitutales bacterium]
AAMSTIDTGINSSSTVLICNLYEPYTRATGHYKSLLSMQVLRTSSALLGIAGIFCAYCVHRSGQGVLDFFWEMMGIVNAGVLGLFLMMRISKKVGPKAAIIGVCIGSGVSGWMAFTSGEAYLWASPFHYMLTLPISAAATVVTGLLASLCFKHDRIQTSFEATAELSARARQNLARRRLRAKKNIFADSLRPKPFHRIYCGIAMVVGVIIFEEGNRIGLVETDYVLLIAAMISLALVILLPIVIKNTTNKRYTAVHLTLLGIALPFLGAMALFSHPSEHAFGYFYLLTLAALGTLVGWTLLGLATMITTALAAQLSVILYAHAGVPDNWALIAVGALAIFTYFAMEAAKENLVTERALARVHTIIGKIYSKVVDISVGLLHEKRAMNLDDIHQFGKAAGEIQLMLGALLGATDIDPESTQLELSVQETLKHVKHRLSKKSQHAITIAGDEDFKVLGNRDIFESIIGNVLDNAVYYIEKDQASEIICTLNEHKRTLTIANNGPTIKPKDIPYIFDLGYSADKESLGLGLSYAKRMLEAMRSGIRLVSKPNDKWVEFRLYFPKYAELPAEAKMYTLQ